MNSQIRQYLTQKYYPDNETLKAALDKTHDNQMLVNLARAGSVAGAGIAGIRPDHSAFNSLDAQTQTPINDLMMEHKARADNLALNNAQINNQQLNNFHDPDSHESKLLRRAWENSAPGIVQAYGDDWKDVTASDKDLILKPLEFKEQRDARREMREMKFKEQRDQNFNKAMSEAADKIEQSKTRGAVKNAWEAQRLVNNAKDILKAYPDLNKMPQQQVALFIDELGKIARGGAATEGSQHSLMPNSVTSSFMSGLSKLGNAPEGAQLGEFLKTYGPYLDDLNKNARTMIGQHIKSTLVGHKNRLRPEDLETLKQNYAEYLSDPSEQKQEAKQSEGRIRVTNGKEHFDILPEDLIHAQKEGFKVVKNL